MTSQPPVAQPPVTQPPAPLPAQTPSRVQVMWAWLPAAVYMLLIWVASSIETPLSLEDVPFQDKGVHFIEYGILGLLISHALVGTYPRVSAPRRAVLAFLGTILWGMLDEIHQAYVPGRNADIVDVWADGLGAIMGTLVFFAYRGIRHGLSARASRAGSHEHEEGRERVT